MTTGKNIKKMNNIIFTIIFLSISNMLYAQREITQQEMREDINFLVQIIKEVNPHIAIREQITKSNLYEEIAIQQQAVSQVNSFDEFYYLAQKILLLTQDQHNNFQDYYPVGEEKVNPPITEEALTQSRLCKQNYDLYSPENSLPVEYINGYYYFGETHYDVENGRILIPAGAKLLRINNIAIDDYITKYNRPIDNSVRWDFFLNKYYTHRIYFPFITGATDNMEVGISYSINDTIHTFNYQGSDIGSNAAKDRHEHKVLYFQQQHILYIRIPAMDMADLDFYIQNILQHKNDIIEKIVVDIRSNGGGNDRLWESVLSAIIKNPFLTIKEKIYLRNTPAIKDYIPVRNIQLDTTDTLTIEQDVFAATVEYDENEESKTESLDYGGKVYVLVNERCFSSALAFSTTCNRLENVITVGQPSGYIGGRGITPLFFSLPYSKLIFSISPVLDATGVQHREDYYDKYVRLPVTVSIDDIVSEKKYDGERYSEEYLFNYDPVFKKVLELED